MKILLTNDDGIEAQGLQALVRALEETHDCLVVAPASEKSASSHSISLGSILKVEERAARRFAVHGTPADCVKFALTEIESFKPELIISGINPGPNTGVSVYYSGTISAAREGLINRIPSIAISIRNKVANDFSVAASFAQRLVEGHEKNIFPKNVLLNVNLPDISASQIRGVKIVRQAPSRFIEEFVKEKEKGGQQIYRLVGDIEVFDPDGTTDEEVLGRGFIAITPLKLDLTDYSAFPILEHWCNEAFNKGASNGVLKSGASKQ